MTAYQGQAQAGAAPNPAASNPYVQPPPAMAAMPVQTSPGLAFLLGLIPGVGAIYNGQYVKGLVHALIFGLLIAMLNGVDETAGAPLLGIVLAAFYFYMPFEAYHTAKKRLMGVPVDEWSSLVVLRGGSGRTPVGPIILIAIGVLFLLDTLHLVEFREIGRFWPVILIVIGALMLYSRMSGPPAHRTGPRGSNAVGTSHEQ